MFVRSFCFNCVTCLNYPKLALKTISPETLLQLAPFELRAKMIVEGVMSGMHRSPYQGMAVEFAHHRQYVAGDDLKHLDWTVYGRSDKKS